MIYHSEKYRSHFCGVSHTINSYVLYLLNILSPLQASIFNSQVCSQPSGPSQSAKIDVISFLYSQFCEDCEDPMPKGLHFYPVKQILFLTMAFTVLHELAPLSPLALFSLSHLASIRLWSLALYEHTGHTAISRFCLKH